MILLSGNRIVAWVRLQPSRYLTLRSALERALEFERLVIGLYNDLANSAKDKDHGTYQLALELLTQNLKMNKILKISWQS